MDKLQFYIRSADKPAGKGVGEFVSNPNKYTELNKIRDWRRTFSSLWSEESFEFKGYHYKSYEHAFQAEKFRQNGYDDTAYSFTIESGTILGNGSGLNAFKARKIVVLSDAEIQHWHSVVDTVKDSLYLAKFTSGCARSALILTADAKIWNSGPRIKTLRCYRLEKTRDILKQNDLCGVSAKCLAGDAASGKSYL